MRWKLFGLIFALAVFFSLMAFFMESSDSVWPVLFYYIGFPILAGLSVAAVRRRRPGWPDGRLIAAWQSLQVNTDSLLDLKELSVDLDESTCRLLGPAINHGPQNAWLIVQNLEKALPRLAKLTRRFSGDSGLLMLRACCLILYSRLISLAEQSGTGRKVLERRHWNMGFDLMRLAVTMEPDNARLAAESGRLLKDRADLAELIGSEDSSLLLQSLEFFDKAVALEPGFCEAWLGRAAVLYHLAHYSEEPVLQLQASVDSYETARRGLLGGGNYYFDFGLAAYGLAELHESRKLHYFNYAAKLFHLAAENDPANPAPPFKAGQASFKAAGEQEECEDWESASESYEEALSAFKQSARLNPADSLSRIWSARCLSSIFKLKPQLEEGGEGAPERLSEAIGLCAQAALLEETEEVYSEWANILSIMAENSLERSGELWAETAEKYKLALDAGQDSPETQAVNFHNLAYSLSCQAECEPSIFERRRLLDSAAAYYEKAASLNNDNLVTLKNWGDVLSDLALLETEPEESEKLAEAAAGRFQKATELYPNEAGSWRRWSMSLAARARVEGDPAKRRELWQNSLKKLERGARACPDDPLTWVMWGRLLGELYWEGPEYERPLTASAAAEKFEKALKLNPDDDEVWSNLGRVCLEAAELSEECCEGGPMANALAAANHFKKACDLSPNSASYWAEWGRACYRTAQLIENEASCLAALRGALDKYETAVALAPEESEYRASLGQVLYQQGWSLEEPEAKRDCFRQAYEQCSEAGRLAPHDPIVWRNWGRVIEALAGLENDPRKSCDWQNEAEDKYYRASILEAPERSFNRH